MQIFMKLMAGRGPVQGDSTQPGRAGWFDVLSAFHDLGKASGSAVTAQMLEVHVYLPIKRGALSLYPYISEGYRIDYLVLEYQKPKTTTWYLLKEVDVGSFNYIKGPPEALDLKFIGKSSSAGAGRWPGLKD